MANTSVVPKFPLDSTKTAIPQIGFGTFLIKDAGDVEKSITAALKVGYTHIDTATFYKNEHHISNTLKKLGVGGIGGNPAGPGGQLGLSREDLFITSKLMPDDMTKREDVRRSVLDSLKNLQTDYIDLYLIHWPGAGSAKGLGAKNKEYRKLAWDELTTLFKEGKLRAIGVSNYMVPHLKELEDAAVKPAVNQCEYHPFLAKRFQPVLDYCAAHKIVFESYMMFGGSNPESKAKLLTHPIVKEVAAALKHSKTGNPVLPSQVLLKFSTQQGLVVLPKSLDEKHMAENLELYDFELSQEQLTKLKALSDEVPGGALHFAWNPTNME